MNFIQTTRVIPMIYMKTLTYHQASKSIKTSMFIIKSDSNKLQDTLKTSQNEHQEQAQRRAAEAGG